MNLRSYLFKRPGSSRWQLRWMVPVAARSMLGRAEFTKSLGTEDRRRAEALAYPILAAWRTKVDEAMNAGTIVTQELDHRPATELEVDAHLADYHDLQARVHRVLIRETAVDAKSLADERQRLTTSAESIQAKHFLGMADDYLRLPESFMRDSGLTLPSDGVARKQLVAKSVRALIDAMRVVDAEIAGSPEYRPADFIVAAKKRRSSTDSDPSVMSLLDRYTSQRLAEGVKRRDSIEQDRIIIRRFAQFVGLERVLSAVSRSDVREWRDTLAKLPRNYTKTKRYDGLDMREAAARATAAGDKTISGVTLNKYLSTLSPFFRWAIQNGYAEANPCDGLFLNVDKQANSYPTFSSIELTAIISSPLFSGFLRDGREYLPGNATADDWRKWIPLLCLFTGSRIGEVAQLQLPDIRLENGRCFIDIKNDAAKGQRTKSGKSRIIPVHRILERAGFINYVDRRRQESAALGPSVFPELERNSRDHIGATPSRFWRTYLARIGIKDGGDGRGSHSFRHTLADELRAAGFLDDQFGPLILGHHKANVTAGYGRLPQGTADMLCAMIDAVQFKGVDFTPLVGDGA